MASTTQCFVCKSFFSNPFSARYPNIACNTCSEKTVDSNGFKIEFQNQDESGGFLSVHYDSDRYAPYYGSEHCCFINNIPCYANEHRFGGIVIKPLND